MARKYTQSLGDGTVIEFEFKHDWFKNAIVGQPGVTGMLSSEASRVASSAASRVAEPRALQMRNPPFMSALDWNSGWPHGRAWASNPVSIKYENAHKVLSTCL